MVTLYIININEIFQQSESVDYFFFVLFFVFKFFCSGGFNFLIVFLYFLFFKSDYREILFFVKIVMNLLVRMWATKSCVL